MRIHCRSARAAAARRDDDASSPWGEWPERLGLKQVAEVTGDRDTARFYPLLGDDGKVERARLADALIGGASERVEHQARRRRRRARPATRQG